MSRLLLFSELTNTNKTRICEELFKGMNDRKTLAYMPSGGVRGAESYVAVWKSIAMEYDVGFKVIDNSSSDSEERDKLRGSHALLISGGNTFQLLYNLRQSGLDREIVDFSHKQDVLIAGFSAGALVLTPTIEICNLPGFDKNLVGLKELNGLGIIDFEIFPHYDERLHKDILAGYRNTARNHVQEITNEDHIFLYHE